VSECNLTTGSDNLVFCNPSTLSWSSKTRPWSLHERHPEPTKRAKLLGTVLA